MTKIKHLALFTILALFSLSAVNASGVNDEERVYLDEDEAHMQSDAFHIHIGHNVWLVTNSLPTDINGVATQEFNISKSLQGSQMAYEKCWKCPYCHNYWPIGKACQNPQCPSKYKFR